MHFFSLNFDHFAEIKTFLIYFPSVKAGKALKQANSDTTGAV
jgi:hypothetical protein